MEGEKVNPNVILRLIDLQKHTDDNCNVPESYEDSEVS